MYYILAYHFRWILPKLILYDNKRILERGIGYPTIQPRVVICHLHFCDYNNIFRRRNVSSDNTSKCSSCFLLVMRFPPNRDWHRKKHFIFAENHHLLQWCLFLTTIPETRFWFRTAESAGKAKMGKSRIATIMGGSCLPARGSHSSRERGSAVGFDGLHGGALPAHYTCSAAVRTIFIPADIIHEKYSEITFTASVGNFPYILRNSVAVVIADSRLFKKLT